MTSTKRRGAKLPINLATLEPDLGEVLGFMRLLWAIAHGLESGSKQMQARIGVTGPQRLVVRLVGHYVRISPGDLAHILRLHPSSLTGVLKRLEKANLIRRDADQLDGRRAIVRLTASGKRLDAQRTGTVEAAVRTAIRALPKAKLRDAEDVLKRIATELELRWGSAKSKSRKVSSRRST